MKVRNLTPEVQELKIVEIAGGREFTIYVEGNSCTDIVEACIQDTSKIGKVFEIVGLPIFDSTKSIEEPEIPQTPEEITPVEEIKEPEKEVIESESEDSAEPSIASEKFICDICGAEFASARGLNSHKSRSHVEE